MKLSKLFQLIILLCLCNSSATGQHYKFREFRQEHGLANLAVTALLQDNDKFLWVGTQNGLYRYDGQDFIRFGPAQGLPGSYILAMAQAPDGTLWVSTHMGVARWQGNTFLTEIKYLQTADSPGMGMAINASGDIFVSTPDGVLIGRKSGQKFTYAFTLSFLPPAQKNKTVFQIAIDSSQRAVFGCGSGMCSLSPNGTFDFHQLDLDIPADQWDGIAIDAAQTFWLRSNHRLLRRSLTDQKFIPVPRPPQSLDLPQITLDRNGHLYLPARDGLWIYNPTSTTWRKLDSNNGLNGEGISAILSDHEQNLWIGFLGDGLTRWLGQRDWEAWTKQEGLNSNSVWALLRDGSQTLWAGTDNGINYFDRRTQRWLSLEEDRGKFLGRIMSLSLESPNILWASSYSAGLIRIDTLARTHKVVGFPERSGIQHLNWVHFDSKSRLWLGTSSGLYLAATSSPAQWQPIQQRGGKELESIYTVTEDSRGRIWAAGNSGLLFENNGTWSRFDTISGLLTNSTWFAREISPDEVFVGYLGSVGQTLIHMGQSPPRFANTSPTLDSMAIANYFSGRDKHGRLWLGTDQGVITSDANHHVRITDEDGLIWNDCNSNAFFADNDGTVWIGTTRGLAHGSAPNPLQSLRPALRINSIMINGQLADPKADLHVPRKPNTLELNLSPLSFRYGNRLDYQFRLGSDDTDWAQRRTATIAFANLPGGPARLQARVRFDDDPWSAAVIDLPVLVDVPFWRSSSGRVLQVLALLLLISLVWRYRNQKLIQDRQRLSAAVAARTAEIERLLSEAREASRLKTEFLANMSHEIRTPMNGVLGMLQLTSTTRLDPEQQNFVDIAQRSAESLLSLLNEILDLSKVESGVLELESQEFSLADLCDHIHALLQPTAIQKGILCQISLDPNLPSMILGDRNRLQQILVNLIGNAIKFTDAGSVKLITTAQPNNHIFFSVRDTGIGISSSKQALIFDAFRQADGSTTRRFGGTGLGLAISQKLVYLMGGKIQVTSEFGLGSNFHFSIALPPSKPNLIPEAPQPLSIPLHILPLQILLAEDNRVNQLVVIKMLERDGHTVFLTKDGAEALEAAQRQSFDLILMDVHMPVLDGIRATELIRQFEARLNKHTPIVALSAGVLKEERQHCLDSGMDAFLAKPIHAGELRQTLARLTAPTAPTSIQN